MKFGSAGSFGLIQDVRKISRLEIMYMYVLPPMTNLRKLSIRWPGPLLINKILNETMIEVREIGVKKQRIYVAHPTKLRLAKQNGSKDINPSFILQRISSKDAVQMKDALSTVVLPAKYFTDQIEEEFCSIKTFSSGH